MDNLHNRLTFLHHLTSLQQEPRANGNMFETPILHYHLNIPTSLCSFSAKQQQIESVCDGCLLYRLLAEMSSPMKCRFITYTVINVLN